MNGQNDGLCVGLSVCVFGERERERQRAYEPTSPQGFILSVKSACQSSVEVNSPPTLPPVQGTLGLRSMCSRPCESGLIFLFPKAARSIVGQKIQ